MRENNKLTRHEVNAITAYLTSRIKQFFIFEGATSQLRQLVGMSSVFDAAEGELGASSDDGSTAPSEDTAKLLYRIDDPDVRALRLRPPSLAARMCGRRMSLYVGHCTISSMVTLFVAMF